MRLLMHIFLPVMVFVAGVVVFIASFGIEPRTPVLRKTPIKTSKPVRLSPINVAPEGLHDYDLAFNLNLPSEESRILLASSYPNGVFAQIGCNHASLGLLVVGSPVRQSGSNLPSSRTRSVVLSRRDNRFFLVADGMMAGSVSLDHIPLEEFAVSGDGSMENVNLIPIRETITFADDFMREMSEPSPWENLSGRWETVGLKNPSLSANPFRLSSIGADAVTLAGKPTWDEYRATVSAMGAEGQSMGLVFCHSGPGDYMLFRLHSTGRNAKPAELLRYRNGGYSRIATADIQYRPGVWYEIELICSPGRVRILVDGLDAVEAENPFMSAGRFGLYASGMERTWFDDVEVGPWKEAVHTGKVFDGLFRPLCGRWENGNGLLKAASLAETLNGRRLPALFTVPRFGSEAKVSGRLVNGEGGLAVGVLDPMHWTALLVRHDSAELVYFDNGTFQTLAKMDLSGHEGMKLELEYKRGLLTGRAGPHVLSAAVERPLQGGAGVVAVEKGAAFGLPLRTDLPGRREISDEGAGAFSYETSMSSWAGSLSDWARGEGNTYWYQAFLPGETEMLAELGDADFRPQSLLALGLKKDGEGTRLNGYNLVIKQPGPETGPPPPGKRKIEASLFREGERLEQKTLVMEKLHSAALRTSNGAVSGEINGKPELSYVDPAAHVLRGYRGAYMTSSLYLRPDSVFVNSESVFNYQFDNAPVDWRPAVGRWEVTNRWQCDDRWSFFSGSMTNEGKKREDKLVLLWNKRRFGDPLKIEMFVSPKMHRERGRRYEYARDFNLSLSPDGEHPLSGYSFLFGAFDNTKSAIVRKGKVVASSTQGLIKRSMWLHRHWYHVAVSREGGRLKFSVDNGRVLDLIYKDPRPIDAGRVAIWSYDCDIMVSRVRISGKGGKVDEKPGRGQNEPPRTIYDLIEQEGAQ